MTGVTPADFNGGVPFPLESGVTYTVAGGPSEWVLKVALGSAARASKTMTFAMSEGSGTISPTNLASAAPLTLTYVNLHPDASA